jgi:hypothetical protein
MKHISLKLFYSHELEEHREVSILQTKSYDNLADLFTKSFSFAIFDKCVKCNGMRRLKDLQCLGGRTPMSNSDKMYHIVLFSFISFTRIFY